MTDRERLIKLICHKQDYGVVPERSQMDDRKINFVETSNSTLADHLLANGVIVPPCKQRDTIYDISEFIDGTFAPEMYEIYVDCISLESDETGKTIFCIDGLEYYYEDFGKTVFLTLEEAEKALAERSVDSVS